MTRGDTIRLIFSIVASHGWKVYQLNVKSAFLHGEIAKEVEVEYEVRGKEDKVCKLKASRAYFSKIESYCQRRF